MRRRPKRYRRFLDVGEMLSKRPDGMALIQGSSRYPGISGVVRLYQTGRGVLVAAEVQGLPQATNTCDSPIFAFHIHEGASCTGNETDPFADALTHYNPGGCAHPFHAGDLPPLFGSHGFALSVVLTDRFTVKEVIGRTVIVHRGLDDFTSQPAGNAGERIACGRILETKRVGE